MQSSSMLCAFFSKRFRGSDATEVVNALFAPFWEQASLFCETGLVPVSGSTKQWEVPMSWMHRARVDGTSRALALLDFRVNRLNRLLAVSDCYPRVVGLHLAHWLDTHLHMVLCAEARGSGPTSDIRLNQRVVRACDWRYEAVSHTLAVREIILRQTRSPSALGTIYTKLVSNMALRKTLTKAVLAIGETVEGKELVCAAFVRCILGVESIKADFSLRKSVFAAFEDGIDALFAKVVVLASNHTFPVLFVALRESLVLSAHYDVSLGRYLQKTVKWNAFAANARNTAEMIRFRIRSRSGDGDLFEHKLDSSVLDRAAILRHSKNIPSVFSRVTNKRISLTEACKLMKRFRDRCVGNNALTTDTFTNVRGIAVASMLELGDLPIGSGVPYALFERNLRRAGTDASCAFVRLVRTFDKGTEAFSQVLTSFVDHAFPNVVPDALLLACDFIELVHHYSSFFTIDLPPTYGALQRAAISRRFQGDDESIKQQRASNLVWCSGCKVVKNFVLSSGERNQHNGSASGYKLVCRTDTGVMCYEKRRYLCCVHVPVRQVVLVTQTSSRCLSIYGRVYVVSTCCGCIALLNDLCVYGEEALCCAKCLAVKQRKASVLAARTCHYCDAPVTQKKGSYVGEPVPNIVYETSDFDMIECTINRPDLKYGKSAEIVQLIDGQTWPTKTNRVKTYFVHLSDITVKIKQLNDVHRYRLAKFFDQKLKIGDVLLNADSIEHNKHEELFEECGFDERHETNVNAYSARYKFSGVNPYLIRIPGFGFVENPTIQIGQILDSMNDYERCGISPAIGFKAKYARRLGRLHYALHFHNELVEGGETVESCPFVLEEYVVEELETAVARWGDLVEATKPNAACYAFTTNDTDFTITRGKELSCDHKEARMNCRALNNARPFRTASKRTPMYKNKDKWHCVDSLKRQNTD